MHLGQGWFYESWQDGQPHFAIDYFQDFNGPNFDDDTTWSKFDVLAAANGSACRDSWLDYGTGKTGYRVLIEHPNGYKTAYWHLDDASIDRNIPHCSVPQAQWKTVQSGDKIAVASDSGTPDGWYHLHFVVRTGGGLPVDPYDLRAQRSAYPDPSGTNGKPCGDEYLWITCPPRSASIPISTSTATPTTTPSPTATLPRVSVLVQPISPGTIQATVSSRCGSVVALEIGAARNALIDIGDQHDRTGNLKIEFPARPQQLSFVVRRINATAGTYVPLTIFDACGSWATFVGIGTGVP